MLSREVSIDERVEMFNRTPGDLTGVDCPKCLNRGYINFADSSGNIITRDCDCMIQRRNLRRIENSGLKDLLDRYTFGNWQTPEPWQRGAVELAKKYADEKEGWFLASGRSGCGKTHLCTAICAKLLSESLPVRYMLWRDTAVLAKSCANDSEEYERITGPLKKVRVLYIDDLFKTGAEERPGVGRVKKPPTAADVNLAFEILNSRYNDRKKLTIISTELSMDELLNVDEATGSRIYERTRGRWLNLENARNWRMRHGTG